MISTVIKEKSKPIKCSRNSTRTSENEIKWDNESPSMNTKQYLENYGINWDKRFSPQKRSSMNITPPSLETGRILNSFIGEKRFKQSMSE